MKVKEEVAKENMVTDSLALLAEKQKNILSGYVVNKKSHSKALVTA